MNLTDNEIIKALECCSKSNNNEEYCKDCPFKDMTGAYCMDLNIKAALDLINRQKAEIERLNQSKSTSLKEFAERLKEEWKPDPNYEKAVNFTIKLFRNTIDNLVKEMVGD